MQTIVIGLGQFGQSLARALTERGGEVLAVDVRPELVQEVAPHVADAICMDAMDEEALASLAPDQRDVSVCAIGNESREASMIVTALLRQLGAPRVIARATGELHARVLSIIGAHEVVMPEKYFGERLAVRMVWRNAVDMMPIGGDLVLTEIAVPASRVGHTLAELDLPGQFGVVATAVRRPTQTGEATTLPDPHAPLQDDDVLVVVGKADDIKRFAGV